MNFLTFYLPGFALLSPGHGGSSSDQEPTRADVRSGGEAVGSSTFCSFSIPAGLILRLVAPIRDRRNPHDQLALWYLLPPRRPTCGCVLSLLNPSFPSVPSPHLSVGFPANVIPSRIRWSVCQRAQSLDFRKIHAYEYQQLCWEPICSCFLSGFVSPVRPLVRLHCLWTGESLQMEIKRNSQLRLLPRTRRASGTPPYVWRRAPHSSLIGSHLNHVKQAYFFNYS